MAGDTVRRISPTTFRIARRGTSREVNRQIALNLIRSKQPVRKGLSEDELLREAGETEILTVSLGEHPGLRGAAALIGTPAFAATDVS